MTHCVTLRDTPVSPGFCADVAQCENSASSFDIKCNAQIDALRHCWLCCSCYLRRGRESSFPVSEFGISMKVSTPLLVPVTPVMRMKLYSTLTNLKQITAIWFFSGGKNINFDVESQHHYNRNRVRATLRNRVRATLRHRVQATLRLSSSDALTRHKASESFDLSGSGSMEITAIQGTLLRT